ncbi:hypothetical protein Tfu_2110 [Thermobifida fusca YX]|nr:hypothetical protein Tfu_2110 [Thermobifida fusca YX]
MASPAHRSTGLSGVCVFSDRYPWGRVMVETMSAHPATGSDGAPSAVPAPRSRSRVRRWRRVRVHARLWRRRMRSHPALHLAWRVTVGLVGSVVLLGGVVMCVTPGPGIGGVIVGLAILATEFSWARRLLWRARDYASQARSRAAEKLRERRARTSR